MNKPSRWHPSPERDEPEGRMRQCYECRWWWPLEPGTDANGDPVRFWIKGERRCYACVLKINYDGRARRAA